AVGAFDEWLTLVGGWGAGKVRVGGGIDLGALGRHREALDDLRRALRLLRPVTDVVWVGRALTARALIHMAYGSARRAELDLGRAEHLFATTGQELEVAYIWHCRGLVAFRSGDVPTALSCLDEADRRYRLLAVLEPKLRNDRCAVLLAAGLAADALAEADAAVAGFSHDGRPTSKAELLLSAARAALASAQPQIAIERADAARRMFGAQ